MDPGIFDIADDINFSCDRWQVERHSLVFKIGEFYPESLVQSMFRGENTRNRVVIEAVLKAKRIGIYHYNARNKL